MAKCYSLGARFMDEQPIFGVEPKATALTPVHFLRYFYYGGLVYIGTKRWRDALDSFVMVRSRQGLCLNRFTGLAITNILHEFYYVLSSI